MLVSLFVAVHNKTQLAEITGRKKVQKREKHLHPVQKLLLLLLHPVQRTLQIIPDHQNNGGQSFCTQFNAFSRVCFT